jgi:hypothetical protein
MRKCTNFSFEGWHSKCADEDGMSQTNLLNKLNRKEFLASFTTCRTAPKELLSFFDRSTHDH